MAEFLAAAVRALPGAAPSEVARLLWCLARIRWRPSPLMAARVFQQTTLQVRARVPCRCVRVCALQAALQVQVHVRCRCARLHAARVRSALLPHTPPQAFGFDGHALSLTLWPLAAGVWV